MPPDQLPETPWTTDGHKVTGVIENDDIRLKLIHPEAGCVGGYCQECGGDGKVSNGPFPTEGGGQEFREETCLACDGRGTWGECWLIGWFDNIRPLEMYVGSEADLTGLAFPLAIKYRNGGYEEGPEWRLADPEPEDEGMGTTRKWGFG